MECSFVKKDPHKCTFTYTPRKRWSRFRILQRYVLFRCFFLMKNDVYFKYESMCIYLDITKRKKNCHFVPLLSTLYVVFRHKLYMSSFTYWMCFLLHVRVRIYICTYYSYVCKIVNVCDMFDTLFPFLYI